MKHARIAAVEVDNQLPLAGLRLCFTVHGAAWSYESEMSKGNRTCMLLALVTYVVADEYKLLLPNRF